MIQKTTQKDGVAKRRLRIIASVMLLFLALGALFSWALRVRFSELEYVGTVLEKAASVTEANTEYLREDELARAWRYLRTAIGRPETYDEYETYASLAIAREDYASAIPYMQGCIDRFEGGSDEELGVLYLRLGSLCALTGDYEQAVAGFDAAAALAPDIADTYLLRAQMLSELGRTDEAVADILLYDEMADAEPEVMAAIAPLYESAGDYARAAQCYGAAIDTPELYEISLLAQRARCYMLLNNLVSAQADLQQYFSEGGEDECGELRAMLGVCRMQAAQYKLAAKDFHTAIESGYSQPALLYGQALLCEYIEGDYAAVVTDGEAALALLAEGTESSDELNAGELHQWIALARLGQADYSGALADFGTAGEADPSLTDLDYYKGLCCTALEQYEAAAAWFTASIGKDESVSLSLYNRAVCLFQTGAYEQGIADLEAAAARDDDPETAAAAEAVLSELLQADE